MVKFLETLEEFKQALMNAGDKLVVVDFSAVWCPPCKAIAPKFEAMSEEFNTDAVFYKVDVDENSETSEQEGIQAMPTFIFYKNTKKIDSFTGANESKLLEFIKKHI